MNFEEKNCIIINGQKIIDNINEVDFLEYYQNNSSSRIGLKGGNFKESKTYNKGQNFISFNKTQNILKLKEFIKNENKANNCRTFKFEFSLLGINYENATMKERYDTIEILEE